MPSLRLSQKNLANFASPGPSETTKQINNQQLKAKGQKLKTHKQLTLYTKHLNQKTMKEILNFLSQLKQNNNRDWFNANKSTYEEAKKQFEGIVDIHIMKIKEFDDTIDVSSSKECIFRIYRDVRFSKNKEPYKPNFGAYIAKGGRKSEYAGYYIHVEPGASFAGGGIYCPQAKVLKSVRDDIYDDASRIKKIINEPSFKSIFPELYGDKLKTAPRGFDKDFPDISLLNFKSYTVIKGLSDEDIRGGDFLDTVVSIFKTQRVFNGYLNGVIGR